LKKSLVTEQNFYAFGTWFRNFIWKIKEKAAKKKLMTFSVSWCSTFHFKSKTTQPLMITFVFLVFLLFFFKADHPFVLDRHGYEDSFMN
jgi:hypothetical protein